MYQVYTTGTMSDSEASRYRFAFWRAFGRKEKKEKVKLGKYYVVVCLVTKATPEKIQLCKDLEVKVSDKVYLAED